MKKMFFSLIISHSLLQSLNVYFSSPACFLINNPFSFSHFLIHFFSSSQPGWLLFLKMCHKVWLDVPTLCEFSFRSLGFLSKFSNTFMCFFCYLLPLFVIPLPALPVFVTLAGVPSFYTTNNSIQSGLCFFFVRKSILNVFGKRQRKENYSHI